MGELRQAWVPRELLRREVGEDDSAVQGIRRRGCSYSAAMGGSASAAANGPPTYCARRPAA
jgi:hypothetical protein